jgi:prolyl-tRNA synthetase
VPRPPDLPARLDAPEEVETPGITTCEALAGALDVDLTATSKAMPVTKEDGTVVLALLRGDDRLEPDKLAAALGTASRPSTDDEIRAAFSASGGSLGPVGFSGEVLADEALREGQFVAGANRDGRHLRGVEAGRDFQPRFADLRESKEGDTCPKCGGRLQFQTAIELGHIFKLGTRYSKTFDATFLDEEGKERPLIMGSYGIGLARTAAAVVEQSHDDKGIIWPRSLAPYDVHVVALPGAEAQAEEAARILSDAGADVLLDDRELRAGEKFADADLIGLPWRVTVGRKTLEDRKVDLRDRGTGEERRVELSELGKEV